MADPKFVHLRLHSDYSLVDGMVRLTVHHGHGQVDEHTPCPALTDACKAQAMPAVGLTDDSNLFALVKFYNAARAAGIKPIMGADLWLESRYLDEPLPVTALIMNATGYHNLVLLISRAWQHNQQRGRALVRREWIKELHEGLIWITGGPHSELGKLLLLERVEQAQALAANWQSLCVDRFYLEIMRTERTQDETCLQACVTLADQLALPLVATNDVRFLAPQDFEAHEARVCIHDSDTLDDVRRVRRYSEQQYLKSEAEMVALFADLPDALANSVEIAKRCSLSLRLGKSFLPEFPTPAGLSENDFIRTEARRGLTERLQQEGISDPNTIKQYEDRLAFELDVIVQMGFPGYFLIVSDFIRWGKQNGVPVGPGRGSGAGSVVAWCLYITDLDPIKYGLLFERFLNPERVSMPDFDVDFCMDNRDRVIHYVADKYGHDAVSQIVTFGTMAAKAVVRDVARVQGKSYGLADKLSKMIPGTPGMTLKDARAQEDNLRIFLEDDGNPDKDAANEIWLMALKLEGLTRNVGKHAGGVVIAPGKLTDFSPLLCDEDGGNLVTQYDKNDVEAAGLVKFDFLGLKTLTLIDWAIKAINRRRAKAGEALLDIAALPLDDARVYAEVFIKAKTVAIFQFESDGMQRLLQEAKPDRFEDLIALNALYRPGPMDLIPSFIARKHGKEAVIYPDPRVEPVLKETYGIMVYQEQVMQMAQIVGGYTLGGADLLRRAMGKKKVEEMVKQRTTFREGAAKTAGLSTEKADAIFDLMEKFAGYGFNKSHAAAYSLVAYQTAWLKVHYPAEFMAAVISAEMQNTDKVVTFINECRDMGLTVRPPEVNECAHHFTVNETGDIVFGLGAIKGLGEGPVEAIVEARKGGAFTDLFDFCRRVDLKKLNRRALEALVRAGAFDQLGPTHHFHDRATLIASLTDALKAAEQEAGNQAAGMMDLFGASEVSSGISVSWITARPWRDDVRLNGEKEALGLFLTGHPIDQYESEVNAFVTSRLDTLAAPAREGYKKDAKRELSIVAGLVVQSRVTRSKKTGEQMAFLTLDDKRGRVEVSVFGKTYAQFSQLIEKDKLLVVVGSVRHDDYTDGNSVMADELMSITDARARYARRVSVSVALDNELPRRLQNSLQPWRGGSCPVRLHLQHEQASFSLVLGQAWQVSPSEALLEQLRQTFGVDAVRVEYRSES